MINSGANTKKLRFLLIVMTLSVLSCEGIEKQPINFNHKRHVDMGIGCDTCHTHVREQAFAGLPRIEICLGCHEAPITKSAEEEKIREFSKKGVSLNWIRLTHLPQHVYFSHRRHVGIAKLDCKGCHGNIAEMTAPPDRALISLKMGDCIGCHEKRNAKTDCLYCHR